MGDVRVSIGNSTWAKENENWLSLVLIFVAALIFIFYYFLKKLKFLLYFSLFSQSPIKKRKVEAKEKKSGSVRLLVYSSALSSTMLLSLNSSYALKQPLRIIVLLSAHENNVAVILRALAWRISWAYDMFYRALNERFARRTCLRHKVPSCPRV